MMATYNGSWMTTTTTTTQTGPPTPSTPVRPQWGSAKREEVMGNYILYIYVYVHSFQANVDEIYTVYNAVCHTS